MTSREYNLFGWRVLTKFPVDAGTMLAACAAMAEAAALAADWLVVVGGLAVEYDCWDELSSSSLPAHPPPPPPPARPPRLFVSLSDELDIRFNNLQKKGAKRFMVQYLSLIHI